jgi:hypothetical protein
VAVDASCKIKEGRLVLTRDLPGRYNSQQERSKSASIFGRKDLKNRALALVGLHLVAGKNQE